MAAMVWCQQCRTVVWADANTTTNVAVLVNAFGLRCPCCRAWSSFDGWYGGDERIEAVAAEMQQGAADPWSIMQHIGTLYGLKWAPSPNNRWGG